MTPDELREHITRLGISQAALARFLQANERTVRRWTDGSVPIPHPVALLIRRLTGKEVALAH